MTSQNSKEIIQVISSIIEAKKIEKFEITWQECGQYNGDDPRPVIKVTLYKE